MTKRNSNVVEFSKKSKTKLPIRKIDCQLCQINYMVEKIDRELK